MGEIEIVDNNIGDRRVLFESNVISFIGSWVLCSEISNRSCNYSYLLLYIVEDFHGNGMVLLEEKDYICWSSYFRGDC